jgi:hypothetical protein
VADKIIANIIPNIKAIDNGDDTWSVAVAVIGSGEYTTPTQAAITVGAATTIALVANVARLYALFVNDSDEEVYLMFGADAVLNEGIRLNANGGNYEMSKQFGNLYTGAVNCICTSGSKILLVTEGV